MDKVPLVYTGHSRDLPQPRRCPACQYPLPDETIIAWSGAILGRRHTLDPDKAREMGILSGKKRREKRENTK